MPITGLFSWSEKNDNLKLVVPLKGTSPKKVDILVTSSTLKINYAPYIVNIVLFSSIDPIKHKATIKDGDLHVTLYKIAQSKGLWGSLENKSEDKTLITKIREDSLIAQDVLEKELLDKRKDRRTDDERYSLRKQMGLDEAERNRLDNLKEEEKRSAEEEVYQTFAKLESLKTPEAKVEDKTSNFARIQEKEVVDFQTYMRNKEIKSSEGSMATATSSSKNIFDESNIQVMELTDEEYKEELLRDSSVRINVDQLNTVPSHVVEEEADEVRYIPPPRHLSNSTDVTGKVDVQFTPRIFPTPMRESKLAEEEDWITKNRRHLKKHGVLGSNVGKGNGVDVIDGDAVWLKARGDDFYRGGDFRSALNAYSAAIDANENMLACYSNRSACYLRLKMFAECGLDCSEGIKRIDEEIRALTGSTPENDSHSISSSNSNSHTNGSRSSSVVLSDTTAKEVVVLKVLLSKLLLRRGATSCQMGHFSEALNDYVRTSILLYGYEVRGDLILKNKNDAVRMDAEFSLPGITKESLSADLVRIGKLLDVDILKKEGDAFFAEEKLEESCTKYTHALQLIPIHVGCLSNRSACRLARKDVQGCIDDCTSALLLLKDDDKAGTKMEQSTRGEEVNMLNSILPSEGSEKRKSWVLKTLLRRAAAYAQLNSLDLAVEDFRNASGLDPKNETLKSDLNKMLNYRESKRTSSQAA